MTSNELNAYLSIRGTTVCLGLNSHVDTSLIFKLLGINDNLRLKNDKVILLFNNVGTLQQEEVYKEGEKMEVVLNVKSDRLNSSIAILPIESIDDSIVDSVNSKNFNVNEWNINNVWLFDSFPYQTNLGTSTIKRIKEECMKKGYGFGVILITGYNQYGSTDISNEDDAISREVDYLNKEGITSMIVNKTLSIEQAYDLQTLSVDKLHLSMHRLNEDINKTIEFQDLGREMLGYLLDIRIGAGISETIKTVKKTLFEMRDLFPVEKYLDDNFYREYEKVITPYFESYKDSEVFKVNSKCAEALNGALQYWMI